MDLTLERRRCICPEGATRAALSLVTETAASRPERQRHRLVVRVLRCRGCSSLVERVPGLEPDLDLAHCRALLMHLPDAAGTLAPMVAALRPGGVLRPKVTSGLLHLGGHPNSAAQSDAHAEMLLAHGLELQFAEIDTATGRSGGPEYKWMRTTVLEVNGQAVTARVIDAATRRVMEKVFATSGMVVTRPSVSSRLGTELTRQRPPCQPLTPLGASCMDGTGRLRVR